MQPMPDASNKAFPVPSASPGRTEVVAMLALVARAFDLDGEIACLTAERAVALFEDERRRLRPGRGGLAPWQAARVRAHIAEHLTSTIRMSDLAAAARLRTSQFHHAFRISFGETPHAHVMHQRIERAKRLMLAGAAPLCEIALACRFADQAHLSRLFRRITGESPNAWRRRRQASEPGSSSA